MPRLNRRGDYAGGVGQGVCHVNDRPLLASSGGVAFVDEDHVIYQVCDGWSCRLVQTDLRTWTHTTVSTRGANHISASGGNWGAWLGGFGIYTKDGHHFPSSGLGPIGPDGALAIKPAYQSAGPWDVLERDGARWRLTEGDASNINLFGARRALWTEWADRTNPVRTAGMPKPLVLPGLFWGLTAVEVNGEWWVIYQEELGRLVLHPFASTVGYVVALVPTYRPAACVLLSGAVRVAWGITEGEWIGHVRTRDLILTQPRTELRAIVPPPPPPEKPMDMPNLFHIVQRVSAEHPHLIAQNTPETIRELYWRVAVALHAADPKMGMLTKSADENHHVIDGQRFAVDAVAHQDLEPIVDIFASAGDGPGQGRIVWNVDEDRRESNKWAVPPKFPGEPIIEPPPPVTHVYDGGSNGTGPCEQCGKPESDPIHKKEAQPPPLPTDDVQEQIDQIRRVLLETRGMAEAALAGVHSLGEQADRTLKYGSHIAIQTDNGSYLCAEGGGGGEVNATRRSAGTWETLTVAKPGS
jgi:hypothetical protein